MYITQHISKAFLTFLAIKYLKYFNIKLNIKYFYMTGLIHINAEKLLKVEGFPLQ